MMRIPSLTCACANGRHERAPGASTESRACTTKRTLRLRGGLVRRVRFDLHETQDTLFPYARKENTNRTRAFSIVELLVTIAIVAILISILLPVLGTTRSAAQQSVCASNQRQLLLGWTLYAHDYNDKAMPLAYTSPALIGTGDRLYWWGADGSATGRLDHARGFISPYLDATTNEHSVYECPSQPDGSYRKQGPTQQFTSTYGYNGYYLSPSATPGWSFSIGHRPWRRLASIAGPSDLLVFADTLLPGSPPSNNALLDPPMLYAGRGRWTPNDAPTTAFRHINTSANSGRADGSVRATSAKPDWLTHPTLKIGSIGTDNSPHYVPDWKGWN